MEGIEHIATLDGCEILHQLIVYFMGSLNQHTQT